MYSNLDYITIFYLTYGEGEEVKHSLNVDCTWYSLNYVVKKDKNWK